MVDDPSTTTSPPRREASQRAQAAADADPRSVPLAERLRPTRLEDVVGQSHLLGPKGVLSSFLTPSASSTSRLPSLILVGPPGSGKTTLARLLAQRSNTNFTAISATDSGVGALRDAVQSARGARAHAQRGTILFIDEIHRFNRGQQDALLPHVEAGTFTLVGATTEHPSFHLNSALTSRARIVQLQTLEIDALVELGRRALSDRDRGMGSYDVHAPEPVLRALARASEGDARQFLNQLELAVDLTTAQTPAGSDGRRTMSLELLESSLGEARLRYDRDGEEHYAVTSAFIKSMRASDVDAAVYWLARMLEGGEDPQFVARRLVIFASEDIGNADPRALSVGTAAAEALRFVGMPEASHALAQATVFMALAPKSNASYSALKRARGLCRTHGALPVPLELRNTVSQLRAQQGYGQGYRYPHDFEFGLDPDHQSHLPRELPDRERQLYSSSGRGWEEAARTRLADLRARAEGTVTPDSSGSR